ncbi:MAG TPA: hypothetical protein EYO97_12975 [Gemmatimonadetes bacterium]|nr:hypothetical protein [Gemmatimonadota bacterium]
MGGRSYHRNCLEVRAAWCLQTVLLVALCDVFGRDVPTGLTWRAAQEVIRRERPHVLSDRGPVQRRHVLRHVEASAGVGICGASSDEQGRENESAAHDCYLQRCVGNVQRYTSGRGRDNSTGDHPVDLSRAVFYYRVPIIGYRQPIGGTVSATAESFLPLKPVHFHILLSLAARATHGYGVRQQVEERTAGRIVLAAGTLYETLQRLTRDGLVEETETPPEQEERASSRWRFYRATALAKQVLALEVARLESDIAAARAELPAIG